MKSMHLWTASGIMILVIIVLSALSVPHVREVPAAVSNSVPALTPPTVTLHDAYRKGVHTFAGTITAPDACASITAEASLSGDPTTSQGIILALTMLDDSGVCLQIPTRINFQTTFTAPANLPLTITVNGKAASTTEL